MEMAIATIIAAIITIVPSVLTLIYRKRWKLDEDKLKQIDELIEAIRTGIMDERITPDEMLAILAEASDVIRDP